MRRERRQPSMTEAGKNLGRAAYHLFRWTRKNPRPAIIAEGVATVLATAGVPATLLGIAVGVAVYRHLSREQDAGRKGGSNGGVGTASTA